MKDSEMAKRFDWYRGRLERATELLREWRDKYRGKEHYTFPASSPPQTASPSDLILDTTRFLEGK